ncbi:MAG: hypothetical protein U0892_19650 [Pirellulales bacterium]
MDERTRLLVRMVSPAVDPSSPTGSMASSTQPVSRSIGFCTVRFHAEHGFFGGYLIVNAHARPLEFHCTLPVKPSRAQSILYGHTLPDFVCGEQIAKALITKAKIVPPLVLTDCTPVLAMNHVSDQLVAWIRTEEHSESVSMIPRQSGTRLMDVPLGNQVLGLHDSQNHREQELRSVWQELDVNIDLTEPFERIAEALMEAHPVMKAA